VFSRFTPAVPNEVNFQAEFESIQPAGPARTISLGKIRNPVAEAPVDADFAQAAIWRIKLPNDIDLRADPILRLYYVGDVARVMLDGKLVTDDFYNGCPLDIGLRRHTPEILSGQLRVAILPLRKDAPIYMAKEARPDFSEAESIVTLNRVEIIPRYQVKFDKSGK
jgi:beta-galactosidase